jgi:hypothetical protein
MDTLAGFLSHIKKKSLAAYLVTSLICLAFGLFIDLRFGLTFFVLFLIVRPPGNAM